MATSVIPLFPLPLVVLPGEVVPLHIFEERYKTMIATCREALAAGESGAFGICLVQKDAMFTVGCTVTITRVLREHEDGKLDIVTVGGRRFRVQQVSRDLPYLTASVEFFDDTGGEALDDELRSRVLERFAEVTTALRLGPPSEPLVEDLRVSFRIGAVALSDLVRKQHLLELTAENQRLELLDEELDAMLAGLERRAEARKIAGSNGKLRTIPLPGG